MPSCFVILKTTTDPNFEVEDLTASVAVALTSEAATAELRRQAKACYETFKYLHRCQIKERGPRSISVKGVAEFYIEEVPFIS